MPVAARLSAEEHDLSADDYRATLEVQGCPRGCGAALLSMGDCKGSHQPSALKPSSGTSRVPTVSSASAGVTLPSDLSGSLKYLDDAQLRRLLEAVNVEVNRRNQIVSRSDKDKSQATRTLPTKTSNVDQIPEGKANLIRASFAAGLKPAAIARTFRISQSLVNRIIGSTEKPKL